MRRKQINQNLNCKSKMQFTASVSVDTNTKCYRNPLTLLKLELSVSHHTDRESLIKVDLFGVVQYLMNCREESFMPLHTDD
jgi:hypothetical protein